MTAPAATSPPARPGKALPRATVLVLAGAAVAAVSALVTGVALTASAAPAAATARLVTAGSHQWANWGDLGPHRAGPIPGSETSWADSGLGAGWPGFGSAGWIPAPSRYTEYFHVASTSQAGPGAIIVTGVINAGGVEQPGRAIDHATFSGGSFRIDHSSGHPTVRFNPATCVGTITQSGPFRVYHATGRFTRLNGTGTYQFTATYTTARGTAGCTKTMTAYIETIDGAIRLTTAAGGITTPGA